MPFNLFDMPGIVADAGGAVPENRRERIGCLLGLAVVIPVALILLLVSFI
ncbi:hypothetical protein [Sphingopyxis fribergensis]|jgi:hypothetical protein